MSKTLKSISLFKSKNKYFVSCVRPNPKIFPSVLFIKLEKNKSWLGRVQPVPKIKKKKNKKKNMLGRVRPNHFGPISIHLFLGLCLAQLSGPA
jgi:hypothetical protein